MKLNGIAIKNPSSFKIELYNVTTLERLADGSMAGDLVAKKRKFLFVYEVISAEEFEKILEAVWYTNAIFFTFEYERNGKHENSQVYVGSIPADLHRAGRGSNWVWKNLSFSVIER